VEADHSCSRTPSPLALLDVELELRDRSSFRCACVRRLDGPDVLGALA
jgi:hypothetical protein